MNPHKPGRKSYHPLLVFEGKSHLCLNGVLRPGNVHSADNGIEFAEETYRLLSAQYLIRYARFDKGFGGEKFYSYAFRVKFYTYFFPIYFTESG